MIKFYIRNKQLILSLLVLLALGFSFAFSADGFMRSFLLGLSAGTAIVLLGVSLNKKKAKTEQINNTL
jgi:hypothetical protein